MEAAEDRDKRDDDLEVLLDSDLPRGLFVICGGGWKYDLELEPETFLELDLEILFCDRLCRLGEL